MTYWRKHAAWAAVITISSAMAVAGTVNLGYISYDVTQPGSTAQFDIVNQTGPNASIFPDTTWPVTTPVNLSSLKLMVHFTDGSTSDLGPQFTLALDGLSFNGGVIPIGGTNPLPDGATLTGSFSPMTLTLNDGSTLSFGGAFDAAIIPTRAGGLMDGDLAIITATTGGGPPPPPPTVPEPGTFVLLALPLGGIMLARRRWLKNAGVRKGVITLAICVALVSIPAFATTSVKLNTATSPDNGVAGVNSVNVTGQGFPSGTIHPANINVTWASTCGGSAAATDTASSIKVVLGTTERVSVVIPGTLASANYFVQISDTAAGDANFNSGSTCSEVKVTHTSAALSACLPTSSLAVLVPTKAGTVTAYVPNGSWGGGTTGVQVVNIEGAAPSPKSVSTASAVNSCSSNPATAQTVCVASNTDVYLITGTTLNKTLTSGATGFAGFSGGSCQNCGVAINALNNKAVINMGLSGSPSGNGIQMLNLATNTFETAIPTQTAVSENISVDPTRNLILSPNESGIYDLLQIQSNGSSVKEFENNQTSNDISNFDSAAEDCSTGIGLAAEEFTNNVFVVDLTQAKLTAGTPAGTWTAPSTNFTMTTNYGFSAGTSGVAAASGSTHLAIITGEFGGNTFAVLKLPSTSGSGTPTILDYAVAQIPQSSTVTGCSNFSQGTDPHTVTAYTSPNDGLAYGLMAGNGAGCVVKLNLAAILAAPRGGSGCNFGACAANDVSAANFPAGAATFFATH